MKSNRGGRHTRGRLIKSPPSRWSHKMHGRQSVGYASPPTLQRGGASIGNVPPPTPFFCLRSVKITLRESAIVRAVRPFFTSLVAAYFGLKRARLHGIRPGHLWGAYNAPRSPLRAAASRFPPMPPPSTFYRTSTPLPPLTFQKRTTAECAREKYPDGRQCPLLYTHFAGQGPG